MTNRNRSLPTLSIVYTVLAIPYNLLVGFVLGVAAPVAAVAAMVLGVRFLTGKMPFLSLAQVEENEERRLSLHLVPADEASALFAAEKEKVLDELGPFADEMKAVIEASKAASQTKAAKAEG
jgi:hypothetical protein